MKNIEKIIEAEKNVADRRVANYQLYYQSMWDRTIRELKLGRAAWLFTSACFVAIGLALDLSEHLASGAGMGLAFALYSHQRIKLLKKMWGTPEQLKEEDKTRK